MKRSMEAQSDFRALASSLEEWRQRGLNEAQTATAIVMRLLYLLEYDLWNPFELVSQEIGNGGIPDFIVKVGDKARFVIEVKKLGSVLDAKTKTQAVMYANNQAIRWALLTNGNEWQLFDSFMRKEAPERLILTLSFAEVDAGLLAQWFSRLLGRDRWLEEDADARLEQEARDIREHLQLNSQLQPLALKLNEVMREFTVQDAVAGVNLMERLGHWDAATLALVRQNLEVFRELAFSQESDKLHPPSASLDSSQGVTGPDLVLDALRRGLAMTAPPERAAKSSGLEAWLNSERSSARNWRDIVAGIAEACVLLGKASLLKEHGLVYGNLLERKRNGDAPYPISAYRQLADGSYLFLHASAASHENLSRRMLRGLGAPTGMLWVRYKEVETRLP